MNRSQSNAVLANGFIFVYGCSVAISVNLGPHLLGADVLTMIALVFLIGAGWRNRDRGKALVLRNIMLLTGIWFLGAAISNAYNHTSFGNQLRGLSIILFFGVAVQVIYRLIDSRRSRERVFAYGMALGLLSAHFLLPRYKVFEFAWKYEFGLPIAVALVLYLDYYVRSRKKGLQVASIALLILGVTSFYLDFRSLGAFLVLTACIALAKMRYALRQAEFSPVARPSMISGKGYIRTSLILMIAVLSAFLLYQAAVESGIVSSAAQNRVKRTTASGYGPIINTLIGSRPEILISSYAIGKRPLIGYGSWPQNCEYVKLFELFKEDVGIRYEGDANRCLIPTHSHLLGAWVWAGILGVPIWLYLFTTSLRWFLSAIRDKRYLELAPVLIGAIFLWNILFSPFSGRLRFTDAFYIVILINRLPIVRNSRNEI